MRRIILATAILLAACGGNDDTSSPPTVDETTPTEDTVDPNDALADAPSDVDDETRARQAGEDAVQRGLLNAMWNEADQSDRDEACAHTRDVGPRDAGYEMVDELNEADVFIAPAIVMQWLADTCDVDWDGEM